MKSGKGEEEGMWWKKEREVNGKRSDEDKEGEEEEISSKDVVESRK